MFQNIVNDDGDVVDGDDVDGDIDVDGDDDDGGGKVDEVDFAAFWLRWWWWHGDNEYNEDGKVGVMEKFIITLEFMLAHFSCCFW